MGKHDFFQKAVPRRFCREYVEACGGSAQLFMFMATALGIKPMMDHWVEPSRLQVLRDVCDHYGLYLKADIIHVNVHRDYAAGAIGGDKLSSTISLGFPLSAPEADMSAAPGGKPHVHVFIARDKRLLNHGMWYPAICSGRVTWPPYADGLDYGKHLGYPACCIRFFRHFNDWNRFSFLAEINRHSSGSACFLCNPLLKDRVFSYIYHMPCSWNCQATLSLAGQLRREIAAREPELVQEADRHLRLPALVFYERRHYVFDGRLTGPDTLEYDQVFFPDSFYEGFEYLERLKAGDSLRAEAGGVHVFRRGREIDFIEAKKGFAPEEPFLVQFT